MMRLGIMALVICVSVTSSTSAEELVGGVTDVTPILKDASVGRVLLRLDLPALGDNVAIRRAILNFDVPAGLEEQHLPLRIYPVTTPWNPGAVDWEAGWVRPGGDFPEDLFARAEVECGRSAGTATIDLTALVKEILEDGFSADGFLVTLDPNFGEGIRPSDLARLDGLASGRVEISSRMVPAAPREVVESIDSARE